MALKFSFTTILADATNLLIQKLDFLVILA